MDEIPKRNTSLARLWRDQGRSDNGFALLQAVYDRFTEGFDTADLKAPDEPGETAGQSQPAKIRDCFPALDRYQIAVIAVAERRRRGPASKPRRDDPRDIGVLLLRHRPGW